MDNIETYCTNMSATIKSLEVQVGQLASELKNQQKGKFPSDTEQNPRDHCKDITLRSGKEVESLGLKEKKGKESAVEVEVEKELEEERIAKAVPTRCSESLVRCGKGPKSRGISFLDNPTIISPSLPFPQRF